MVSSNEYYRWQKCGANGGPIYVDEVEQVSGVHWNAHTHVWFSDADVMMHEAYCKVVHIVAPIQDGSAIPGVVECNEVRDLENITFPGMQTCLQVLPSVFRDQAHFCVFSKAAPDKTCRVFE